jgi:Tfp pilus assembly protein FimT
MQKSSRRTASAFSLAELLISLSIWGLISSFSIAKVINVQQSQKTKAVLKETVATLASIIQQGIQDETLVGTSMSTYVLNNVNAVKICTSNSGSQGCWNNSIQGTSTGEEAEPGFILANGATVVGVANTATNIAAVLIDANGTQGPNQPGEDQLHLGICIGPANCTTLFYNGSTRPSRPGSVGPVGTWQSNVLYDSLFK